MSAFDLSRVADEVHYWDQQAQLDDIDKAVCDPGLVQPCLDAIEPHLKPGSALEIGCGVGRLMFKLIGWKHPYIHGIDISQRMIDVANARMRCLKDQPHGTKLGLSKCDGRRILMGDGAFDNVYSVAVFQHLDWEGMNAYICEAARVLKAGGVFRFQFIEGLDDAPFSKHHDLVQVQNELECAGFDITSYERGTVHHQWTWITAIKSNPS